MAHEENVASGSIVLFQRKNYSTNRPRAKCDTVEELQTREELCIDGEFYLPENHEDHYRGDTAHGLARQTENFPSDCEYPRCTPSPKHHCGVHVTILPDGGESWDGALDSFPCAASFNKYRNKCTTLGAEPNPSPSPKSRTSPKPKPKS